MNNTKEDFRRYNTIKKITLFVVYSLIFVIAVFVGLMLFDAYPETSDSLGADKSADPVEIIQAETPAVTEDIIENETLAPTDTSNPAETPVEVLKITYGQPENFGFDPSKLKELDDFIQGQIDEGFPGAVLMVAKNGYIVFHNAYGYSKKYDGMDLIAEFENMQLDTMFDLASLTKIYATTFSIMKLTDSGYISLDGKVSDYLSGYGGGDKDEVTIQMLLSHNAGYTDSYYFYRDNAEYSTRERKEVYNTIKQIPLSDIPGNKFVYNDLNYMILGMVVEEVSGMRIDEYAKSNIYEPLGIDEQVTYRPLDIGIEKSMIAASERMGNTRDGSVYFQGIREYTIQGEVHDENAYYSLDQISGHAGLFATCYGLTVLNQLLINRGEYEGVRIYSED